MISKGWIVAMALAVALVVVGVCLGEPAKLFLHAASACLACLGVG